MLRGLPHLTKYMPEPKDARRLIPDPENELNFYAISKKYPLPDDPGFGKNDPSSVKALLDQKPAAASPSRRLASQVDWMQNQLPAAKRQAVIPASVKALLELAAAQQTAASLSVPHQCLGTPSVAELQQLVNGNNQLLPAIQTCLNIPTTKYPSTGAIAAYLHMAKNGGLSPFGSL